MAENIQQNVGTDGAITISLDGASVLVQFEIGEVNADNVKSTTMSIIAWSRASG